MNVGLKQFALILLVGIIGLAVGCKSKQGAEITIDSKYMNSLGIAQPGGIESTDFTLKTLDGKDVSLSDYQGKIVFLNFWATWCPPCRGEMPSMEQLYQKFKDKDFVMLAVDLREDKDAVEKFIEEYKLNFPVLLDSKGKVGRTYMVTNIPTTYLISNQGNL